MSYFVVVIKRIQKLTINLSNLQRKTNMLKEKKILIKLPETKNLLKYNWDLSGYMI